MHGFLTRPRSSALATVSAVALCALVAWLDYRTGPDLSLALLYLIPVGATGWLVGARTATVVAILAAAGWLVADLAQRPEVGVGFSLWNGFTRLVIFTFCGVAIAMIERRHAAERHRDRGEMRETQSRYRELFAHLQAGFAVHEIICDDAGTAVDYRFLDANPAFERLTGLRADEVRGRTVREVLPNIEPAWIERYGAVALTGEPTTFEEYSSELQRTYEVVAYSPAPYQFATLFTDITERRHLQAQLAQAMRMEAVGRLAGGIAHDFNNILTVINVNTDFLLQDLRPGMAFRRELEEIKDAGKRAASLTNQLLAFSRQQVLEPQIVDLNVTVARAERLLQRLLGEDILLRTKLAADLGRTKVDPTQIEQVIMNLAVNARDAMPTGGHLLIETANVELDEEYTRTRPDARPGPHVLLAVTDTGTGMDEATQARIFEPFFTTKEQGRGTGLGLSTLYGIVKQSGGHVLVYSEVDHGTTFKVYFPRVVGETEAEARPAPAAWVPSGNEVVLVAEDAPAVRHVLVRSLERLGYRVLEADGAEAALTLARDEAGPIDLLVTDVVMPQMGGRELAAAVHRLRPSCRVLYVSGYTTDAIVHHGILDEGLMFLQKPFTPQDLARKVRAALAAEP